MNMPPLPEPVIVAVDQIVNSLNVQLREATARAEAAEQETAALRADAERWHGLLGAAVDIYFDGVEHPPGEGCYASGALREIMNDIRTALNAERKNDA